MKQEFLCGIQTNDFNLMKTLIDSSVKIYNEERPHFSNFMLPPQQMHQQSEIKMSTYKKTKN